MEKTRFDHPTKSLKAMLLDHASAEDKEAATHLADFLEKCFALNPKHRLAVEDAFKHPFLHHDDHAHAAASAAAAALPASS
jgi:hypothetical protein